MNNGSLTLNGISDAQLDTIVRVKEQHEGAIDFNPQQLQPTGRPPFPGQPFPPQPQQAGQSIYNDAIVSWHSDEGIGVILELLHRLYPNGPVPPFAPLS
jgi:hypothetical protein